ncbi:MAG: hypothetical protein ACRCZ0_09010 [Cetobacterium sp.]
MDDVFNNQYLLDIILKYLTYQDELNLLKTLKIEVNYVTRKLNIAKHNKKHNINTLLLKHTLPYLSQDVIQDNFPVIWQNIDSLTNLNESFYVDNYGLIKKYSFFNGYDGDDANLYANLWVGNFIKNYIYTICSKCTHKNRGSSDNESWRNNCSNCRKNTCKLCDEIMLPVLVLDNKGLCQNCSKWPVDKIESQKQIKWNSLLTNMTNNLIRCGGALSFSFT